MNSFPRLTTSRLVLRQFALTDVADIKLYAGDKSVAATTLNIPHPYEDGMAENWINAQQEEFAQNKSVTFATERIADKQFIGAVGLEIEAEHNRAALGYYIGMPFWRNGYATEAATAVLAYGFKELKLQRIYAFHFTHNPASGRVMQKIGMHHEGSLRQHIKKWEEYVDEEIYGILQDEFQV